MSPHRNRGWATPGHLGPPAAYHGAASRGFLRLLIWTPSRRRRSKRLEDDQRHQEPVRGRRGGLAAAQPVAGPRPHRPCESQNTSGRGPCPTGPASSEAARNDGGAPKDSPPKLATPNKKRKTLDDPPGGGGPGNFKIFPTRSMPSCTPYRWYFHTTVGMDLPPENILWAELRSRT